jgi:hypothetical protein
MEKQGKKGSRTLVEGRNTGRANLTVKFKHPEYPHIVEQTYVQLTVLPNLELSPGDVFMVPTTSMTFDLCVCPHTSWSAGSVRGMHTHTRAHQRTAAAVVVAAAPSRRTFGSKQVLTLPTFPPHLVASYCGGSYCGGRTGTISEKTGQIIGLQLEPRWSCPTRTSGFLLMSLTIPQ